MFVEYGVVSVTVWSVSSSGEIELIETSGGLKTVESKLRAFGCAMAFGGSYKKLFSVSGVSSTEMDLIDKESSLDRLVEEAA